MYEESYKDNEARLEADRKQQEELKKMLTEPIQKTPHMSQLEVDAINVLEKRVEISSFLPEYQQQIKNFYRFSPINIEGSGSSASISGRRFWK